MVSICNRCGNTDRFIESTTRPDVRPFRAADPRRARDAESETRDPWPADETVCCVCGTTDVEVWGSLLIAA